MPNSQVAVIVGSSLAAPLLRRAPPQRVAAAGLSDRVTVLGSDWRDLRGRYSKLVSVELQAAERLRRTA